MIIFNGNLSCEQVRGYYYDYLCEESQELIPLGVHDHINKCQHCQAEINRLKTVLAENESDNQTNCAVITNLRLHFAYIGTLVTCKTVKLFLPGLADLVMKVRVPTPITVHLDKCGQCAKDLETIRQLNLSHKQLCRLGQLFAEEPAVDATVCTHAQNDIPSVVSMIFHKTNAEVLKHLCICPDCRNLVFQRREKVRKGLLYNKLIQNKFPCEEVLSTDIFDYCFPYGIDPAADQYVKFRSAFTSHVSTCPKCLGKIQELYSIVYGILERDQSGITTRFELEDFATNSVVSDINQSYEGRPVKVETFDKSEHISEVTILPQKLKQKPSVMNLRRLRIPAAAAIILLAIGLFFLNTPTVKAVGLAQIYNAIEQIKNVYVATFYKDKPELIQERWVSQDLNTMVIKTETQCILWNIRNKLKKIRNLNTGSTESLELSKDTITNIKKNMKAPWGLLPFDNISNIPKNAKWQRAADENIKTIIPNTQVYTLLWTEKEFTGSTVSKKCFFHIDTETKLPRRIEQWQKANIEKEYELITVRKVTYPDSVEIQSAIEDAGF